MVAQSQADGFAVPGPPVLNSPVRFNPETGELEAVDPQAGGPSLTPQEVEEEYSIALNMVELSQRLFRDQAYFMATDMVDKMWGRVLRDVEIRKDASALLFGLDRDKLVLQAEKPQIQKFEAYRDGRFMMVVINDKYCGFSKAACGDTYDQDTGLRIALHRAIEKFFPDLL